MIISPIKDEILDEKNIRLDLLRLDLLHPVISGNKWYKLKYNIVQAQKEKKNTLLSFGGAYSNHLHALAYTGKEFGMKTIGIIRGEKVINETLSDCSKWGMELHFIERSAYKNKNDDHSLTEVEKNFPGSYVIPEGGNNALGLKGCAEILNGTDLNHYDHIVCAVGTAATFSGLIESSWSGNILTGFAAIKNGHYLSEEIKKNTLKQNWEINTEYHFGGFAKKNKTLLDFMEQFKANTGVALDFIYNAKMMYGLFDLIKKGYFNSGRILAIHTGGLQGNRSLI